MHIINQKGETIVPENVTAFVWCDGVVYGERYRPKAWHDNSKQPEQVWFIYDANEIESRYLNPSNNRFYYGAEFQDRRDFEAEVVKRGLPPWDNGHVYFYEKLRWPGAKNLPSCINRNAASDYGKKP
ncbi:MAG: hypothetical protein EBZ69_03120 [Alphaproteobacteria bacterium]|nr:hypothetical protein [Alphaproteobacteria bacterium]